MCFLAQSMNERNNGGVAIESVREERQNLNAVSALKTPLPS